MRRFRVNLGALVLVSGGSLVFLFGSINYYWMRHEITDALAVELETRALHHAQTLAQQALDAMLVEDRLRLTRLMEETRSMDEEIAYAFLVDPRGELVAHTFADGFPVELLNANTLPAGQEYMVRRIVDRQGRQGPIRDVVAPIAGGYAGFVHVGLRERMILRGVETVGRAVGGMVVVLILLGLAASLLFVRVVTRPVQRLADVSRQAELEELGSLERSLVELQPQLSSLPGLETEVDRLAQEFQRMVSRLADAYRQLGEAQKQLVFAERLSTIGTIAAGLAHELNNPLAGLKNCVRRIRKEPQNREQLQRYLSMMQESVERMERVLQGLLDLARPRRTEVKELPLAPLLDRVILLAGHKLADAEIQVQKEVHTGTPTVCGDEVQLEQALLNLVLNACDSMALRRQTDAAFRPRLTLQTLRRDSCVVIEVTDNGLGIEPQNAPRIFDPFFTTKAPGQGTGLGLSIARNIVRAHGGDIEVENRPEEGATFRIVLNLAPKAQSEEG